MKRLAPTRARPMLTRPVFAPAPRAARLARTWRVVVARLPKWALQWQMWLVLAIGASLRLVAIGRSPFGSDDALLFLEAARTTHDRLLPGTGIFNSLLALNFPAYTFLLLPFANQPQGLAVVTAVANVVAVACLYVFTERMFGRWAALIAALLFATATYATWMSVFIWQQTIVIPITLVALWLAFEGAVRQRRHWLAPHLILLALAIQVYPQAISLLPVTVVAIIFGWRTIRWVDVLIAENICCLIWLPTVLFELASGGFDLPIYLAWLRAPKVTNTQALVALSQALGPQSGDYLGANTWYTHTAPLVAWLTPVIMALWALGTVWLAAWVVVPLGRGLWRRDATAMRRLAGAPAWRAHLLLLLWPLGLLAATIRHATPVYVHYVFLISPVIYVTIGVLLVEAPRWLAGRFKHRWAPAVARLVPVVGGGALVVAQAVATGVFVLALASGQATAASWGVIPIDGYTQTLAVTSAVAERLRARQVFIASDPADPYMGQYWSLRENNLATGTAPVWASAVAGECALLPAPGAAGLILTTAAPGPALASVLRARGTQLLRSFTVARGASFVLYQVQPNGRSSAPLARAGDDFQLESAAIGTIAGAPGRWLITHWTALASTPAGPAVYQYQFHFQFASTPGMADQQVATCEPSAWQAGDGVVLAVPVPAHMASGQGWRASVAIARDTHTWYRPQLGTLEIETAKELTVDYIEVPPGTWRIPGLV